MISHSVEQSVFPDREQSGPCAQAGDDEIHPPARREGRPASKIHEHSIPAAWDTKEILETVISRRT
jgi:hypothetical protein